MHIVSLIPNILIRTISVPGDLRIISSAKLKEIVSKGPKYGEPVNLSWKEAKTQMFIGLHEYIGNFLLIKVLAFVIFVNGKTK